MRMILVAGSACLIAGCGVVGPESTEKRSYDVSAQVKTVDVRSGAGDVEIVESDRAGVRVTETLKWRGTGKPSPRHPVEGEELVLTYECGFAGNCSVDYRVEVPKGTNIQVDTGAGDTKLTGVTGLVDVKSGAGNVNAIGLAAKKAKVETGSGEIDLRYALAPDQLEVDTGAGDTVVRLPNGPYALEVDTGAGERAVEVATDPSAPRKINLQTGAGDVRVLKAVG